MLNHDKRNHNDESTTGWNFMPQKFDILSWTRFDSRRGLFFGISVVSKDCRFRLCDFRRHPVVFLICGICDEGQGHTLPVPGRCRL